jgi:two-component system, OmpR family, sensor kinase
VSLRVRLTLILIVLATIGLVTADVVSYRALRSFLLGRADASLATAFHSLTKALPVSVTPTGITTYSGGILPGDWIQLRQVNDRVMSSRCLPQFQETKCPPAPKYPAHLSLPFAPRPGIGPGVSYFTVGAVSGGGHYRVRSSIEQGQPDYVLLIATPLTGAEGTLHRLVLIELVATAVVLAVLAGLALWLVGLGLRPLAAMGETAKAITQGDLSRRIEQADEKTEIGRLGSLLNTMLSQIEAAFQAREESETKLRRFVADASHELRTPVTAIRAYAELFSRGAAERPEDIERSMQGVRLASERMSALVDDLFLLAHLDEGRPLAQEAVDLDAVVADAIEFAHGLEPARPFAVDARETIVIGDRSRLRQLVDNLLANVRAHTPPAAPVRVMLAHAGDEAVLSVADAGPGIEEASLRHVFERFYRAEASQARAQGGSGLGLAIVQALAEAHGGTAAASSRPGAGATFTITLPLAPIEILDAPPPGPAAAGHDRPAEPAPEADPARP